MTEQEQPCGQKLPCEESAGSARPPEAQGRGDALADCPRGSEGLEVGVLEASA